MGYRNSLSPSLSTQLIAPAFGVDSTILCSRSILLRRCICPTRIESRDSQMESTKTIAFAIHSVDRTSLFAPLLPPAFGVDSTILCS